MIEIIDVLSVELNLLSENIKTHPTFVISIENLTMSISLLHGMCVDIMAILYQSRDQPLRCPRRYIVGHRCSSSCARTFAP
jgi:hypothetical protein